MTGYWPSSLFGFYGPRRSRDAKAERDQYPAIFTELAWSIKYCLYGVKSLEKNDLRSGLFSGTELLVLSRTNVRASEPCFGV